MRIWTCVYIQLSNLNILILYHPSMQGLLSMKVGHFFGMSQAENASIHQNYMVRSID